MSLAANLLNGFPALLAGDARYVHLGRRFRPGGSTVDLTDLMSVVSIVAVVAAIAWLATRFMKHREKRNACSPQHLFRELCKAHQLNRASRQLLQAIAKAHQVPHPAMLFVMPQYLESDSLPAGLDQQQPRIEDLRKRLFGA